MKKQNDLVKEWRDMGPVAWAESDHGFIMEDGRPITLTPWQRAVLESYSEHSGEVTTLAISNIKKTGKTLLNAVLTGWRWLALPGQHFTAANDLDQSQARQFGMIAEMVRRNPYLSQVVKVGKSELLFEPTGSRLTALASDATGNAGANFFTASHTEAWGILYEAGIRAWEELTPPPGRWYDLPALRIADSYAGYLGESATWHKIVDRGLTGRRISKEWPIYLQGGLMLFHAEGEEARDRCFRGTREEAAAYYEEQRETLRPNSFDRMHNNMRTEGESAFVEYARWEACKGFNEGDARRGDKMVLGADASTSGDYSALVGVTYNQDKDAAGVRYVKVWKPRTILGLRSGKPTIDIDETIGQAVLELYAAGLVRAVVCDVYQLHTCVIKWEKAGIRVIELNQGAGRVDSDQALYNAINAGSIRHFGDPDLDQAIKNAVARETPRGFRLDKETAHKKIDAAVALSMAHWGAKIYFGKHDDSGPNWMPDIWFGDIADAPTNAEMDDHSLQVIVQWELQARKPFNGRWHVNAKPHPEGVTWRNCRHRNRGCITCKEEMDKDGTTEELRKMDEFYDQQAKLGGELPHPLDRVVMTAEDGKRDELVRMFWSNVRNNLKENKQ